MREAESSLNYDALIKESEFLSAILESIDDGIVACNAQGELTLFNQATRNFHGLPEKAMPIDDLADYYDLLLADGVSKMTPKEIPLLRALKGEIIEDVEMVIAPKKGPRRRVLASGRALKDSKGNTLGAVIAMNDITEQKNAEQKAEQSQAQLLKAQEIAQLGYWEWDLESGDLFWTKRLYELYDLDPKETLSYELFLSLIHPEDQNKVKENIEQSLKTSRSFEHLHRTFLKDGSIRFINGIGEPLKDETGKTIKMAGVAIDVSQATQAAKDLKEAKARFSAAFESSALGMAIVSPQGNWLELNKALCKSLGYSFKDLINQAFMNVTHPDDKKEDERILDLLFKGEIKNHQFEKRFLRSNGETMFALVDVSSVYNEGNLQYFVCNVLDITETHAAREAVDKSERRFRAIFEAQPSAIVYTDAKGRIEETNSSIDFLFGYAPRELVDRNIWVLYQNNINHQSLISKAKQEVSNTLWQEELICLHKQGHEINCELTGRIVDEGNKETHIWVFQNISERKKAKLHLQELNLKLARSREEERLHIAREIHDQSIQDLIGVNYGLASLQRQLDAGEEINLKDNIQQLRRDIVSAVKQLRGLISELRPAALEEFGFEAALEGFVSKLERNREDAVPSINLSIAENVDSLTQPILICFFRAAQEALNNIVKHAEASSVTVSLKIFEDEALMVVEDDGKGFSVPSSIDALTKEQHYGLAGMEERVKLMEGQLRVRSQLGSGTEVSLTIPLLTKHSESVVEG